MKIETLAALEQEAIAHHVRAIFLAVSHSAAIAALRSAIRVATGDDPIDQRRYRPVQIDSAAVPEYVLFADILCWPFRLVALEQGV